MLVVEVLAAIGVLFAVSMVATGRFSGMATSPPDRAPFDLPDDRPLRSSDLGSVRFSVALRGYRMEEVDALLDRLARELAERDERTTDVSAAPETQPGQPDAAPHDADEQHSDRDVTDETPGFSWDDRWEGRAWPTSS